MNSKLKSRRKIHYVKIMSLFLVIFIVVSGAYAVITYNHTHDTLLSSMYDNVSDYFNTLLKSQSGLQYLVNSKKDSNEEVRITRVSFLSKRKLIAHTGNYLAVKFGDWQFGSKSVVGVISFKAMRKSLSDSDYNKIKSYLTKKDSDYRYALLCREFFFNGSIVYPKKLSIVKTRGKQKYYNDKELVESFEANTDIFDVVTKAMYKSGDKFRNEISSDFMLGKYSERGLMKKAKELGIYGSKKAVEKKLSPFTYLFYAREATDNIDRYIDTVYELDYAASYNILEECSLNLILVTAIIFAFFTLTGVLVSSLSWKSILTEIEQERIRIEMTNAMAHDLKTPLFVISGYAENLRDKINAEKSSYYADVIIEQTSRMNELIHKMLDYSRFETGRFELNRENFRLDEMLNTLVERYHDERLELKCGSDKIINADRNLLATVTGNFIDNALKYGSEHCPVIIELTGVRLSVSNKIDAELTPQELKKIWEPYTKLDSSRYSKGNGLGLAIAKSILDMHGFSYGSLCRDGMICFYFEY